MTSIKSYSTLPESRKIELKDSQDSQNSQRYVFSCPSSLSLSFAVWLVDDFTEKEPIGKVRVSLEQENVKPVKNLSGYYTFSGLPKGKYTLCINSELYFPEERLVDTSSFSGSKEPVVEIILKPKPLYPFPDRATLLRGTLAVESGLLADITIKAISKTVEKEIQGIPDEKGEFVLYFKVIKGKADVILKIKGKGIEKIISALLEEGQNTYLGLISIF